MQRNCAVCNESFDAKRPQAKYCSTRCRTRASRAGLASNRNPAAVAPMVTRETSGLLDAVQAELEAAGKVNTVAGQHALELASRIVNAPGMNTGVAALSKQLQNVLAEALRGAASAQANPLDELKKRRDRKRTAAG